MDCPVLYNTEVKSVEDGPDTATTNCADLIIKSRYIVAADGAHSSIRKKLGIKFQGEKPNMRWAVLDSFLKTDFRRILLAGDAAHVHSVNGGQGLNTGISDAFALAWRLNMACKVMIPGILRSYDQERRTTAQGVVDVAAKLVRSTMRTAEEYVNIVEKSAANITGEGFKIATEKEVVITTRFDLGQRGEVAIVVRPDLYVGYAGVDANDYFKGIFA
ncbi:unnamed protein product [Sphagnum balticum]